MCMIQIAMRMRERLRLMSGREIIFRLVLGIVVGAALAANVWAMFRL